MRGAYRAACVVLLAAAPLWAAPPDVPVVVKAKPGQLVRIVVKGEAELGTLKNFTDSEAFWGELVGPKGQRHFVFQAPADGTKAEYVIGWWAKGETEGVTTTITIEGVTPPVPPGPGPDPGPKPPDPPAPKPGPLRVILVYETAQPLTPVQQSVIFGEKVRQYLDAKSKGWRRYDKDVDAANERDADLKALWSDAKGKITAVPCVVVASGARAEIMPLPADEAAALELFKKYAGE